MHTTAQAPPSIPPLAHAASLSDCSSRRAPPVHIESFFHPLCVIPTRSGPGRDEHPHCNSGPRASPARKSASRRRRTFSRRSPRRRRRKSRRPPRGMGGPACFAPAVSRSVSDRTRLRAGGAATAAAGRSSGAADGCTQEQASTCFVSNVVECAP
jgi:hypothetical protein